MKKALFLIVPLVIAVGCGKKDDSAAVQAAAPAPTPPKPAGNAASDISATTNPSGPSKIVNEPPKDGSAGNGGYRIVPADPKKFPSNAAGGGG